MKALDMNTWPRREAYGFFSGLSNPFYMVSFKVDVTRLYDYTKAHGLSFYMGMVWACTRAVNQVAAFRVALREGQLVEVDRRDPSFTDRNKGAEQFHIVTVDYMEDADAFCREAARLSREQTAFVDMSKETDDLIYFSCLPWIDLTAMTNERDMAGPGALDDSIPRITWGKYTQENERKTLCVSLEVNHRCIDGLHIGRFNQALETCINNLK